MDDVMPVAIPKSAERQFRSFGREVQNEVADALRQLIREPREMVADIQRVVGGDIPNATFALRTRHTRIIFGLDAEESTLILLSVDPVRDST